jgi:hypothetical protein
MYFGPYRRGDQFQSDIECERSFVRKFENESEMFLVGKVEE